MTFLLLSTDFQLREVYVFLCELIVVSCRSKRLQPIWSSKIIHL